MDPSATPLPDPATESPQNLGSQRRGLGHEGPPEFASSLRESQLVQRALFEGAGDHVLILEINPGEIPLIVDLNQAALEAHGYSREELLGQPVTILDPEMDQELGAERDRLIRKDPQRAFRARHRRKDGSLFEVEVRAHPVTVGDRLYSIAVERDLTSRLEAERALQESEQRLREAQALARIGHWEHHHVEGWTKWSEELHRIHQSDPASPPPSFGAFLESVHPEDRPAVQATYQNHLKGLGEVYSLEYRVVRADGQVRHIRSHCSTQFGPLGDPIRTFGTDQDVTERKLEAEARQALEAQLNHLQRMESVGRLAAGVAHDMNNVLAAILAVASQLRLKEGPEDASAQLILKACLRGRDMVKQLMDFSRKEVERREVVDLHDLLRTEAKLLGSTTLGRIVIELDLQADPSLVLGEATALSNALMNLSVNAIDAMPGGGRLRLRTRNGEEGRLEVLVEDTGTGMAREVADQAIEPFFTTKPRGKGTGLGLSIAYGVAKSHGGSLELASAPGRGTTVKISLPVSAERPSPGDSMELEPSPAGSFRVLFVDDDLLIRETAPLMLESKGHRVRVASGGREAMAALAGGLQVDVVVLDLNMPDMDGWATVDAIRLLYPLLPVIITTGFVDRESIDLLLKRGNLQVLAKPYALSEIQAAFAKI